jgi:hypothetical protein
MAKTPGNQEPANLSALVKAVRSLVQAHQAGGNADATKHSEIMLWTKRAFAANTVYVGLTLVIAGASLYAAYQARRQAVIAEDGLKLTKQNFQADQRPYIYLASNNLGEPTFYPNKNTQGTGQVIWTYHYTNYGKTPALNVKRKHYVKVGSKNFEISFQEPEVKYGVLIPPNMDTFNTVVSSPGISQDEFSKLVASDQAIEIAGEITYSDASGGNYVTNFCIARLSGGAILFCQDMGGNQMK